MVYCIKCGTENGNNAVYCIKCGQKLQKIPYDEEKSQETSNSEMETLQEMIHVARSNKGIMTARKILYFTDQNIYIGEGSLITGMGFGLGGLIGHSIEKKVLSDSEKEAHTMNFRKKAAQDPEMIVIPYQDIINLNMGKKKMFIKAKIKINTTSEDYEFYVLKDRKYKEYLQTIPTILGDKVNIE